MNNKLPILIRSMWVFASMCLSLSTTYAQGSITGKIQDENGEPLEFATVEVHKLADSTLVKAGFSNESGTYRVAPLDQGKYYLRVTFVGIKPVFSEAFDLAVDQNLELPTLKAAGGPELQEVKITTEKPLVTVKPDMTVFNVQGTVNAMGENAFNLLRKAPGVVIDNNDNVMLLGKSGVRIMIDGKPSPLSAADLANLLKSMQSDQIENIEIITNPSAKYDAEGNAGIINIRMKRDKNMGANATVNFDYSAWVNQRLNGSISGNYRAKKFNAFGSYSGGVGANQSFMNFYRTLGGQSFTSNTIIERDYVNHNFRGGLDYYINKKHTIGFLASGVLSEGTGTTESNNDIRILGNDSILSTLESIGSSDFNKLNYNANLNYRFDNQKGSTLNIDLDYGTFRNENYTYQPNTYRDPKTGQVLTERNFANDAPTDIDIYTFKADYERPLWKGKLGAGVKAAWVSTRNTFDFFNETADNLVLDSSRSNTFDYLENVNAAYANYSRQMKKWGIQIGVRAEQTNSLGKLDAFVATTNDTVERHYLNLFPSAGVTYNLNQLNTFRLTYSRRIDRPRYEDLNPFVQQIDELSYRVGNPFLQPQFTHNMEVGYTYKYTLNASVAYSITSGFFTNVVDTIESIRTQMTQLNLSERRVLTGTISYPWSPFKWWSTFSNASVFNVRNLADSVNGKSIDLSRTSFTLFHQSTFNLPKEFGIQLSGFYNSPGIWGANFRTIDFWGVEVGATKKLFKQRGLLKVGMSDIFFTMQWGGDQAFGGLTTSGGGGWESRQIKASYTHTFGNTNVKGGRKRSTGLEDEQKRAGEGGGMGR
jgi:outer membrane receptor protein involved in Fe transport